MKSKMFTYADKDLAVLGEQWTLEHVDKLFLLSVQRIDIFR